MGKALLLFAASAFLASEILVHGITLPSRRMHSCGYVGGQVYCYGGVTSITSSTTFDDNLYSLNVAQFIGQPTDSIHDKWEQIQPSTPFNTEARRLPSAVVLPDGKRFLLQGGYTKATKFINQTIIYDTTTNSWENGAAYVEGDRGVRQIYSSAALMLPNNQVGFYGGYEQFVTVPQTTASGAKMPVWGGSITPVGFSSLTMYSPDDKSWTSVNPQSNLFGDFYPNQQTATLDPASGKVYYLGGRFNGPSVEEGIILFKAALTFDTNSGTWQNETLKGIIPVERIGHTAHLLPNSRDIILYGGTKTDDESGVALQDYCYTLNLVDNTWTEQSNLNVPSILGGPRFGHSSVLVNTTLLVFFGKGLDGTLQPATLAFDVANVKNISYTSTLGTASAAAGQPNGGSSLSKGEIGGIAAGAVIAVLAIIAAAIFCIRRKRKSEQKQTKINQDEYNTEIMHVDWDKLDNQFTAAPFIATTAANSSPHSANTHFNAADSTQRGSSPYTTTSTEATTWGSFSPGTTSHANANEISVVKPSVDEGVLKPSFESTNRVYTLNKPDAV